MGWKQQALTQGLPIDRKGHALHVRCARYIQRRQLRRGEPIWQSKPVDDDSAAHLTSWESFARVAHLPVEASQRAVITDALSFPLTAALALKLVGIGSCELSVLILGAEEAELAGLTKWFELLHALGSKSARLLFVGPLVPRKLDATSERILGPEGRVLHVHHARGHFHDVSVQARVPSEHMAPQLALACNSGLAEHVRDWAPTLRALIGFGIPFACTSYHAPEADLDARTLHFRFGCRLRWAARPNPFASQLPHLDETFPGRVYMANSFLTVSR
jgi:hypothetical protein